MDFSSIVVVIRTHHFIILESWQESNPPALWPRLWSHLSSPGTQYPVALKMECGLLHFHQHQHDPRQLGFFDRSALQSTLSFSVPCAQRADSLEYLLDMKDLRQTVYCWAQTDMNRGGILPVCRSVSLQNCIILTLQQRYSPAEIHAMFCHRLSLSLQLPNQGSSE